ncbi:uncharacterized protein EV420DRAFT_1745338 [Desarmillaria tabescens]|uniref:Cupredoxin n=1 Tax=Armillaria tabescens TaxID=1929756 RepID=A0AA39NDX6_ARMTA|nr:uncharacterized protein EV420DRAFT_1745338 [Desarmillaria tabescens]KAK0463870.1 hypothetical protein EV420DRAFT_1745338 [Desarmillaria tabescens]
MSLFFFFAVLVSAICVFAADHLVTVGDGGMLAFNPTSMTAVQGDTVTFSFLQHNRRSPLPAQNLASTRVSSPSPTALSLANGHSPVDNSSTLLWFFCTQMGHCEKGMVFAVNPTQDKTFQAFLANAQGNGTAGWELGLLSAALPRLRTKPPGGDYCAVALRWNISRSLMQEWEYLTHMMEQRDQWFIHELIQTNEVSSSMMSP